MRYLVTGATGFIGSMLVDELTRDGYQVNVLVRSPHRLAPELAEKVTVIEGDIFNTVAIDHAMENCDAVFHLAAFAGIWSKDMSLPYKVNVHGTENILKAAVFHQVNKVVYTSTAGTVAPSENLVPADEDTPLPVSYHTDYERSKLQAEKLCSVYAGQGLDVVVVNPTRVFGPGPLNKSNSVTILIKKYLEGKWRFLPGDGESTGNYAYVGDVVKGHILAMQNGVAGEKYILGGTNVSFNDFFGMIAETSGRHHKLFHIPYPLVAAFAETELFLAETFGKKPLITPPWAGRYRENRLVSSDKAMNKLNYNITPLKAALDETIKWLSGS